jgi:hypothetical protein
LPENERGRDYVRKTASARDFVAYLQTPENYERDMAFVPDVPVELYLSTTGRLPKFVRDIVKKSKDRAIFGDKSLAGLCMNGRGMPIRIFLHDVLMHKIDPSGKYFEEIFWHEYVHGAEGIVQNEQGAWVRLEPWSYTLQQRMLEIDRAEGFDPFEDFRGNRKLRTLLQYLREGTEIQENVSEVFARAACAYMVNVRDTKAAPDLGDFSILMPEYVPDFSTPLNRNVREFFEGAARYSPASQKILMDEMPMIMAHVHVMYGCKM